MTTCAKELRPEVAHQGGTHLTEEGEADEHTPLLDSCIEETRM